MYKETNGYAGFSISRQYGLFHGYNEISCQNLSMCWCWVVWLKWYYDHDRVNKTVTDDLELVWQQDMCNHRDDLGQAT